MRGPAASVCAGFAVAQEDAVQSPRADAPAAHAAAAATAGNTTGRLFAGSRIPMGKRPAPPVVCRSVNLGGLHQACRAAGCRIWVRGGEVSPARSR
jgi:hypothetical protein